MFTQRAGLLGFVAFCFYLIAVVNSLPGFYYLLAWMSLGLLAASLGIALLSLVGLDCQWRLGQNRGYAIWSRDGESQSETGEVPTLHLSLRNTGSLNKTGVLLEVQFKSLDGSTPQTSQAKSRWAKRKARRNATQLTAHRFLLEAIPSGSTLEVSLPLYHLPRGRHEVVQLLFIGSDVLGLFRTRKRLSAPGEGSYEFIVGPPVLVEAAAVQTAGRGRLATGSHRIQRFGVGDEVRGTRPYVPGDDLRHVHWKSTARLGEFVVREWEHTGHAAVLVVWDGAKSTTWGRGPFDTTEIGLSLVGSLCATLARAGIPCALAGLGEEAVYIEPTDRTGSQILPDTQFKALASARAVRSGEAARALDAASRGRSRDYDVVFWVTASLSPILADSIRRQSGRVQTRVALVDGAKLREWSIDSSLRHNAAEPVEGTSGVARAVPVSGASYDAQQKALREAGAFVVRLAPAAAEDVPASLRAAVESLVELA